MTIDSRFRGREAHIMHKKPHSVISEIMAWIVFTILAVILAFPLTSSRYQDISWESFLFPAGSTNFSALARPAGLAKAAPLKRELSALEPSHDLLKTVSANTKPKPKFSAASAKYDSMIERAARQHQVSPILVKAIIQTESNFNPSAVSHRLQTSV